MKLLNTLQSKKWTLFVIVVAIVLGCFFRLIWNEDMEWKGDEQYNFSVARAIVDQGIWPLVGQTSSFNGVSNPPFGMWIFGVLSFITPDPLSLNRAIEILNILSILGFCLFIFLRVEESQRELWLWGMALMAVNPLAILFSRKLWIQDLLPFFCLLMIFSHTFRQHRLGALLWGFFGALLGQIHMLGFIYTFSIWFFTVLYDFFILRQKSTRLGYWFLGTFLGCISLIPWMLRLILQTNTFSAQISSPHNFYALWLLEALGFQQEYSLGAIFTPLFYKEPIFFGQATYGVQFLRYYLAFVGCISMIGLGVKIFSWLKKGSLWDSLKHITLVDFYVISLLCFYGGILTVLGISMRDHYMIFVFPFSSLFLVRCLFPMRRLLMSVVICHSILSGLFLSFIHSHQDLSGSDYGVTYRQQMEIKK